MTWLSNHLLHLLLIAAYLAILARHALVGQRHVRSLDDYLVAGRRMGGVVIAISFYATFMSTNTFIGAAGKSWDTGLSWCMGGIVLSTIFHTLETTNNASRRQRQLPARREPVWRVSRRPQH